MHLVVYTSKYTGEPEAIDTALADIHRSSSNNNPKHDITGVLFFHDNTFVQVLEGERAALDQLMNKLQSDSGHSNVNIIIDEPIKARSLENWNMDSFNIDASDALKPDTVKEFVAFYSKMFTMNASLFINTLKGIIEKPDLITR